MTKRSNEEHETAAQDGPDLTKLLVSWNQGDSSARDELMNAVYTELRYLAGAYFRRERPEHTLQPTALVNEAYLRLIDQSRVQWQNRSHFYGIAAQMMRRVLIDHSRRKSAEKRGSGDTLLPFDENIGGGQSSKAVDLMALDEALEKLEEMDPALVRLVEQKYFAGLTIEQISEALDVSPATVKRDWNTARTFLRKQLQASE